MPETMLPDLIARLDRIADLLERHTPPAGPTVDRLDEAVAFLWRRDRGWAGAAHLVPVRDPLFVRFDQLRNIDGPRSLVERNTRQFVQGLPANNVLMTGARGTGKSSLVRACLEAFHRDGLRLIEVEKQHLDDLPEIVDRVRRRPERFIIFCDDLSFEDGETGYKGLKTVLDGSIAGPSANVLIYATSNRRHLVTERAADNLSHYRDDSGELHPGDTVEEKTSLSERFGLWTHFYSFSQDEYLEVVAQWLGHYGYPAATIEAARQEALQWALSRGARSGRIARQFASDYAGRHPQAAPAPA